MGFEGSKEVVMFRDLPPWYTDWEILSFLGATVFIYVGLFFLV